MPLNPQQYREAIIHLGPETPVFTEPRGTFRAWVKARNLPADVAELVLANAIEKNVPFPQRCGGIWRQQELVMRNEDNLLVYQGLLAIGCAINGDPIVIDVHDDNRRAGFVNHEQLWSSPPENLRTIFVPLAEPIHQMLARMAESLRQGEAGTFPIDYCSAVQAGFLPCEPSD